MNIVMSSGRNYALLILVLIYFLACIVGGLGTFSSLRDIVINMVIFLWALAVGRQVMLLAYSLATVSANRPTISRKLPAISVIMPAFNEEKVIAASLASILKLDYPNYEIIVIDDGSTDKTGELARQVANWQTKVPVRYIWQPNRGKSAALNTGIKNATGSFFLCIDTDSRLNADALRMGIRHFGDERLGAIAGSVYAANQNVFITKAQHLEYLISQNVLRKALSYFGAVLIVPGPVGLFRRQALLQAEGYRQVENVFSEDADLTVRLLAAGWKVQAEPNMVAHTEVPEKVFDLLRQRYRWKRGVFQAFRDNAFSLFTDGGIREVLIGSVMATEAFMLDIFNFGVTLFFLAHFLSTGEINPILALYAVLLALDLATINVACRGLRERFKWMLLYIPQKFTYSYVLQAWCVLALADEWRATHMSWDKLGRIGSIGEAVAK